jgi:hypothetical protein
MKDTPSAPAETPSFRLDDMLTEVQAARLTRHPPTVLAQYRSWRNTGKYPDAGPDFFKVGKAVFYTRAAIDAYNRKRGV